MFGPACGMAEFTVDLEIARIYPRGGKITHHPRGDRRWKEPIRTAQYIKDFRLDLREVLYRVVAQRAAPQDDQRVCVPELRPINRQLADCRLTRHSVRVARS